MTDRSAGPRCGNNPNTRLTPGDLKAVDDAKARLALQAAAKPYIERAAWVDFDPLMEVIASTVWKHCGRDSEDMPQLVCDDPRTIAAFAAAVARAHAAAVPAPATDQAAEPLCVCGHPMRLHHEDVCLTECGCNDGLEAEAADLPDRLAAALTARFTERGNPFAEMRRHEQGPDGWPASHPVGPRHVAEVLRELLAAGARATAVLPAPADRATVLREAADAIDAETRQAKADEVLEPDKYRPCRDASAQLRRMADETQQPETEPLACSACRHFICGDPSPCRAITHVSAVSDEQRCGCTARAAAVQQPKEA